MQVLVIGAHGKTGQRLMKRLAAGPHDPIAMVRHPGQRPIFDALRIRTVLADLEHPIDHAVVGVDAVIFAAGSGSKTGKDKTVLVDQLGAIRAMVAAETHGARRFVMLSTVNSDVGAEGRMAHYFRAKGYADRHLREGNLDYTIVCPGRLIDDPGTGRVATSSEIHASRLEGRLDTSRDNLAAALATCLDEPGTIGKAFSLVDGETPVAEALARL